MRLTLGTAIITQTKTGSFLLRYMSHGNFTVGERFYANAQAAHDFCRARGIKVFG